MSSKIVKLNVGGKAFMSTRETLVQSPMLKALMENPTERDETGALFIDRSPKVFQIVLELLRTGVLFWDDLNSLRAVQIECDFYLLSSVFQNALCPIEPGLYTVSQADSSSSHPWILFVESHFDSSFFSPCQVFLTGVVDEEVLLRYPANLCCAGFLSVSIRGRTLSLSAVSGAIEDIQIQCSWTTEVFNISSGDRVLTKQSVPNIEFPTEQLPLKQKLIRTKSKGRKIILWFERTIETGEILLLKQKSWENGRTYSSAVTVLCPSLFIYSNNRDPLGLIFLSGRVPFLIKRRQNHKLTNETSHVPVIALQRERVPRIANI